MLEEGIQESQRGIVRSSVDPELRLPQGAARLPRPAEHSLHVDGGYGERGPVVFPTYLHCLFLPIFTVCSYLSSLFVPRTQSGVLDGILGGSI